MFHDRHFRAVLFVGALFNVFMATAIVFPDSVGSFADLPRYDSRFFPWVLALFIALFAGVYAYLAVAAVIDRSLVVLAIIGKTGVFLVALACLILGELSFGAFVPAIGDLIFALVFLGWIKTGAR